MLENNSMIVKYKFKLFAVSFHLHIFADNHGLSRVGHNIKFLLKLLARFKYTYRFYETRIAVDTQKWLVKCYSRSTLGEVITEYIKETC